MKKFLTVGILVISVFCCTSCSFTKNNKKTLNVINVGDYINEDLIVSFEEKYDCNVIYTEDPTNEMIYDNLLISSYDVCIVQDYMFDMLRQENKIQKLDFSKLTNFSYNDYFKDAVTLLDTQCKESKDYIVPYFWGTFGIMYRSDVAGLKEYIEENDINAVFKPSNYKKGMYDSARFALSICNLASNPDVENALNSFDKELLERSKNTLIEANYKVWGADTLKEFVANGTLDMALVFSGDYIDRTYTAIASDEEINFSYYNPEITDIWIDSMCIPSNAENVELAYEFINYFASPEVSLQNAAYIGYAPLSESVFNKLFTNYNFGEFITKEEFYPYSSKKQMLHYVSKEHNNYLRELLTEIKEK